MAQNTTSYGTCRDSSNCCSLLTFCLVNCSDNFVDYSFDLYSISLEVMTLNPVCESVETSEGVPVTVTGVAQVKIMRQPDILRTACEQFLGKSVDHIQRVILQTLEGHLRAILGELLATGFAMTILKHNYY